MTTNEFDTPRPKIVDVNITKTKSDGKWIVRIHNVTSGFVVHTESDNSTIEFGFDAARFTPYINLKES